MAATAPGDPQENQLTNVATSASATAGATLGATLGATTGVAACDDFEAIFRYPTLEKMFSLSWRDFERFIAYVFTCAGYHAEDVAREFFPDGPGVDLNIYAGAGAAKPTARVEIKRWRQQL